LTSHASELQPREANARLRSSGNASAMNTPTHADAVDRRVGVSAPGVGARFDQSVGLGEHRGVVPEENARPLPITTTA
jgi:hypothetical protein